MKKRWKMVGKCICACRGERERKQKNVFFFGVRRARARAPPAKDAISHGKTGAARANAEPPFGGGRVIESAVLSSFWGEGDGGSYLLALSGVLAVWGGICA